MQSIDEIVKPLRQIVEHNEFGCFYIDQTNEDPIVTIRNDGTVEVNPKYELDDAARAFWDAVRATSVDLDKVRRETWEDIESAPKDGTEFLGYDATTGKQDVCSWQYEMFFGPVQSDGTYGPAPDEFRKPTHWMPLPAPPARAAVSRGKDG